MLSNDPTAVREQYASEASLETRSAAWRGDAQGRQPQDVAAASIAAVSPMSILEVGCGTGVFAARLLREHPTATLERSDLSTRAVFPDHASARSYLATFDADLAEALPAFAGEREYAGATSVFTAR